MTIKTDVTVDGFNFTIEVDYNSFPTIMLSVDGLEYLSEQPGTMFAVSDWLSRNRIVLRDIYTIAHHDIFTERSNDGVLFLTLLQDIAQYHKDKVVRELASQCLHNAHAYQAWREGLKINAVTSTRKQKYVYLAYSDTGHYKIGISNGPKHRIKVFDTKMPVSVSIVHLFPADNARKAEEKLHTSFSSKHHNGEWFSLDDNDVSYIRSIKAYENGKFKKG